MNGREAPVKFWGGPLDGQFVPYLMWYLDRIEWHTEETKKYFHYCYRWNDDLQQFTYQGEERCDERE